MQMSIEKSIPNIFLGMSASTNIIIHFYYKIKTMGGRLFFNKKFHNIAPFCIFGQFSSFCHIFVTNTAFVTFQEFENNQGYKPKHNLIVIEYHNFW